MPDVINKVAKATKDRKKEHKEVGFKGWLPMWLEFAFIKAELVEGEAWVAARDFPVESVVNVLQVTGLGGFFLALKPSRVWNSSFLQHDKDYSRLKTVPCQDNQY